MSTRPHTHAPHDPRYQIKITFPVMPDEVPLGMGLDSHPPHRVLELPPDSVAANTGLRVGDELMSVGPNKVGRYSAADKSQEQVRP